MQWSIVFIVLSIVHIGTIYGQCQVPDIDICSFVTCGNGTCEKDVNSSGCYRCQCQIGYTGSYCETEIAAEANCGATCQNGGRCEQKGPSAYACVCPNDFIGLYCETSVFSTHICAVAPEAACKNGATCTVVGNDYLCGCTAGWTGRNCETDINSSTCPINVCLNGGVCRMNNGVESCTCPAGYTGEICDMLIPTITPPITTSSTITPSTTLSSTITPSTTTYPTTTTSGSSQGNSCASRPCLNGAQCFNNGNSYFCLCKPGYTGQTCASQLPSTTSAPVTQSTISACASNPCLNGGSCYKFEDSFICSCTPYYTGDTCDKAKVFTTTQPTTAGSAITCANQPCKNGATCYTTGNSYFCFCGSNSMYTGTNCDTPKPTSDAACPLDCSPGYCIKTGAAQNAYACMCNGAVTPSSCGK